MLTIAAFRSANSLRVAGRGFMAGRSMVSKALWREPVLFLERTLIQIGEQRADCGVEFFQREELAMA